MATIKYSSNTATETVNVPFVFGGTLTSRGDGTKTVGIYINPITTGKILTVTGSAKIYTNEGGTLGEASTKSLTHAAIGSATTYYIKLTSGTAKWYVNTKQIDEFATQQISSGHENAPKIGGDFSNWVTLTTLRFSSRVNFVSSITKVCNSILKTIELDTAYNEGVVTGIVTGAVNVTKIKFVDYINRISSGLMYITGDVTNFVANPWLELVDQYGTAINVTGDLTNVDPTLLYGDTIGFTGDGSAWTNCYYIEDVYSSVNYTTLIGMTRLGYCQLRNRIYTETQINQFLADLRANVATVKGYAPSETTRTFDLSGLPGTAAPTGQGLIDKQFLIDWVGGSGQTNNVTTR